MGNNGDELLTTGLTFGDTDNLDIVGIGNFHKTLPHNKFGEVDPKAYALFKNVATQSGEYEMVPIGYNGAVVAPEAGFLVTPIPKVSDKLNNPQAARAHDALSGPATDYSMTAAPGLRSLSTAAEMTELQWMAILRDTHFTDFATNADVTTAIADIDQHFRAAVAANEPGGLRIGTDLPRNGNDVRIDHQTLFRCGLLGEDLGPLVSQFFLHDIAYGAQFIEQKVRPYAKNRDFLTEHGTWLRAQNAGLDEWGHGYAGDNDFATDTTLEEPGGPRRLTTMRDIARFVNKDALHQAYFNATLLCLAWNVPNDPGNPYTKYKRQSGFGTLGGPDVLTRVSEVASRALAIVWCQKWEVHRRLRPEVYGGLMQMQQVGLVEGSTVTKRPYGLPASVFSSVASQRALTRGKRNYYLPIAFTAGSPPHPSYGAGHATVAGACVTVLKAWFAEKTLLKPLLARSGRNPFDGKPIFISQTDGSGNLIGYTGPDASVMTVEGELNKIACNVAMGRSMGGVHWRSDNTRSLRLGEQIAAEMLRGETLGYAEKSDGTLPSWSFTSFNGNDVLIHNGRVLVNGVPVDPKAGPL